MLIQNNENSVILTPFGSLITAVSESPGEELDPLRLIAKLFYEDCMTVRWRRILCEGKSLTRELGAA